MYEQRHQPLLTRAQFGVRLVRHVGAALGLLTLSLGLGIWGYAHFEGLSGLDAFLNAAMLLGGMGPLHVPVTPGGKAFAGLYALYAGLVFILATAMILTPIAHRVLHKFHWDEDL